MKYIQYAALCAVMLCNTLKPTDSIHPSDVLPETQTECETRGKRLIDAITHHMECVKGESVEVLTSTFAFLIEPHLANYCKIHAQERETASLHIMTSEELIASFFPAPMSSIYTKEMVQILLLYTAYFLLKSESPDQLVSIDYSAVITEYITAHTLEIWVETTLERCCPGITSFLMPAYSRSAPSVTEHCDTTPKHSDETSSTHSYSPIFGSTDDEVAYYLSEH
jgi:hypothetical protein